MHIDLGYADFCFAYFEDFGHFPTRPQVTSKEAYELYKVYHQTDPNFSQIDRLCKELHDAKNKNDPGEPVKPALAFKTLEIRVPPPKSYDVLAMIQHPSFVRESVLTQTLLIELQRLDLHLEKNPLCQNIYKMLLRVLKPEDLINANLSGLTELYIKTGNPELRHLITLFQIFLNTRSNPDIHSCFAQYYGIQDYLLKI
jgi:hypothetical protein